MIAEKHATSFPTCLKLPPIQACLQMSNLAEHKRTRVSWSSLDEFGRTLCHMMARLPGSDTSCITFTCKQVPGEPTRKWEATCFAFPMRATSSTAYLLGERLGRIGAANLLDSIGLNGPRCYDEQLSTTRKIDVLAQCRQYALSTPSYHEFPSFVQWLFPRSGTWAPYGFLGFHGR